MYCQYTPSSNTYLLQIQGFHTLIATNFVHACACAHGHVVGVRAWWFALMVTVAGALPPNNKDTALHYAEGYSTRENPFYAKTTIKMMKNAIKMPPILSINHLLL